MAVKGKRFRFLAGPRNDMVRGWGGVRAPAGVDIVGAPPARPFEGLPPQRIYDRVRAPRRTFRASKDMPLRGGGPAAHTGMDSARSGRREWRIQARRTFSLAPKGWNDGGHPRSTLRPGLRVSGPSAPGQPQGYAPTGRGPAPPPGNGFMPRRTFSLAPLE